MILSIDNAGREIVRTNFWEMEPAKVGYSCNAGAVRVLLPHGMAEACGADMRAARVAVLTLGKWAVRPGVKVPGAHLMFDDDTNSPYCLTTDVAAFDVVPDRTWEGRKDGECIVYGPYLQEVARLPLRVRRRPKVPCYDPEE